MRIIKSEHLPELLEVLRISETHHRIAVHQDTITLVGNDERNGYLCIILEELLVLSLIVEFISLMLSKAIQGFILRGLKYLTE